MCLCMYILVCICIVYIYLSTQEREINNIRRKTGQSIEETHKPKHNKPNPNSPTNPKGGVIFHMTPPPQA